MISCIIPAHNGEKCIGKTIESLLASARECAEEVEIIVVINGSTDKTKEMVLKYPGVIYVCESYSSRVKAQNQGATMARGNLLAFIDEDLLVTSEFFSEISEKGENSYYVGGGMKWVKLTRYSLGIVVGTVLLGLYLFIRQITLGVFWIRAEVFKEIGGFPNVRFEDIGFALRIKKYARANGRKFESLKRTILTWSTRRFNTDGDWSWLKPGWFSPEFIPHKKR